MLNLSIFDLLVPVFVLLLAVLYLPVTLLLLLKDGKFSEMSSWESFEKAWFSRFWSFFGMASRALFAPDVEKVLSAAHGIVLDIGTGSGDWIYLFSEERDSNISKLYLVEPNTAFHPDLQKRVREYGLQDKCQIVRRTEDLEEYGVQPGSVDTISTVHVLCSVAAPESLVKLLYSYLRPGGQWLVYEHVKASTKWSVAGAWQAGINTVWPLCLDGCSMTRDTKDTLLHNCKWTSTNLRPGSNEGRFNPLPHIVGVLVK